MVIALNFRERNINLIHVGFISTYSLSEKIQSYKFYIIKGCKIFLYLSLHFCIFHLFNYLLSKSRISLEYVVFLIILKLCIFCSIKIKLLLQFSYTTNFIMNKLIERKYIYLIVEEVYFVNGIN